MGAEVLKKFGKYFLLDQIAQGGMAEIYRARPASVEGASRLIVIKRIQAGFGANDEFLQMFKSEIKVMMGFNHPNIVSLYDFGEESSQPYIVMELVDGRNLRQFLTRFTELKQTFPVDLAAYIMEQAASGLHYAHSFKDKISGEPLNIVHRDISPQNILISYEGNVKVIDFGIAKATVNSESTRAGVIKGKPSYLSPEQISGEQLDGRCDIFALGIVLWELLAGKKLFAGENDFAVLKLIESCNSHVKPPSTLNPKVPKELDYIVLKTLAKQREKRYQTGEELQRALHKFLYTFNPDFNPGDLSYYAKDLFKNEIVEDRKRIQKLNEKAEQLIGTDIPDAPTAEPTASGSMSRAEKDTTTIVEQRATPPAPSRPLELSAGKQLGKVEIEHRPPPRSTATRAQAGGGARSTSGTRNSAPTRKGDKSGGTGRAVLLGVTALAAVTFFGPEFGIEIPYVTPYVNQLMNGGEARLMLAGEAKNVTVMLNGQIVAKELPSTLRGIPVGTPLQLMVSTANGGVFTKELKLKKGEQRTLEVTFPSEKAPEAAPAVDSKKVLVKFNISPAGAATVSLNGIPVDPTSLAADVRLDAPMELVVERPGYRTVRREFVLDSKQLNGLKEWAMDVQMEPTRFGYVTIRTTPSANATIVIDGKPWVRPTPIENEKLPPGTYTVRLVNEVLGMEKTITVNVQEGRAVTLDERLEIKN